MQEIDKPPAPPAVPLSLDLVKDVTVIGRRNECDLVIEDTACSKVQCRIFREGVDYRIVDLDSQNGTFVNEERVSSKTLKSGDRLRLGFSVFLFSTSEGEPRGIGRLSFLKKVKPAGSTAPEQVGTPEASPEGEEAGGSGAVMAILETSPAPAEPPREEQDRGIGLTGIPPPAAAPLSQPSDVLSAPTPSGAISGEGTPSPGKGGDAPGSPSAPSLAPAPVPAPRVEPSPPAAPRPGSVPAGALLLLAAALFLLAGVVLFAEELRSALGLGTPGRQGAPAEKPAGDVRDASLDASFAELRDEIRGLKAGLRAAGAENASRMEEKILALETTLAGRMERSEEGRALILAEVQSLRQELEQARAETERAGAQAGGSRTPAPGAGGQDPQATKKAEEDLSPEERLFREVMAALERKG